MVELAGVWTLKQFQFMTHSLHNHDDTSATDQRWAANGPNDVCTHTQRCTQHKRQARMMGLMKKSPRHIKFGMFSFLLITYFFTNLFFFLRY